MSQYFLRTICPILVVLGLGILLGRRMGCPLPAIVPSVGDVPLTADRILPAPPPTAASARSMVYQSAQRLLLDSAWLDAQDAQPQQRQAALRDKTIQILSTLSEGDRLRQFSVLMEFLRPGDFAIVMEGFRHHDLQGRSFHDAFKMLVLRAAEVGDPGPMQQALKENRNSSQVHPWYAPTMQSWASNHPQEAIAWWNELPDGSLRDAMAPALVGGIGMADPALGWTYAKKFPPEAQLGFAATFFDQTLLKQGADQAVTWIQAIDTYDIPQAANLKVDSLKKLGQSLWAAPVERVAAVLAPFASDPNATPAFLLQINKRGPAEPVAVAQWVQGLQQSPNYPQLRNEMIRVWTIQDAPAAQNWAQQHP
jgi:hypothetical protein